MRALRDYLLQRRGAARGGDLMIYRRHIRAAQRYGRFLTVGLALVALFAFGGMTFASATQSPNGCNENDFILQIKQVPAASPGGYAQGSTVTYTVRTGNNDPTATGCDIDTVTVTLTTPDGVVHTLQTNGTYPFSSVDNITDVGSVAYVVNLNNAVAGACGNISQCPVIVASAKATGILHDDPAQDDPFTVIKQVSGPVAAKPLHFLCYELKRTPPKLGDVSVVDQFGAFTATGDQPHHLCNPADKNDEDQTAPNSPEHLVGYDADSSTSPAKNHVVQVTNQFGTRQFQLKAVQQLSIRSSKGLNSVPPPLVNPVTDNFVCYTVKDSPFTKIRNVKVDDQFGTLHVDLTGIRQFCDPANVANSGPGAQNHANHLTCYSTDLSPGNNFTGRDVFITNQFESKKITLDGHVNMLCVPSTKVVIS
jgi:hypothetical protein